MALCTVAKPHRRVASTIRSNLSDPFEAFILQDFEPENRPFGGHFRGDFGG
jgi:hypothetical protein